MYKQSFLHAVLVARACSVLNADVNGSSGVDQLASVTPLHFGTSFHFPGMERFNGIPMEIYRLVRVGIWNVSLVLVTRQYKIQETLFRVDIQIYNSVTLALGYFVDKHSKNSVLVYIR